MKIYTNDLVKGHSDFKVKCLTFGLYTQVSDSGPLGPLVNRVLLPYLPIYKTIFSHAYFKRKVFFHQISKEKSAAYYIPARTIVRQIR